MLVSETVAVGKLLSDLLAKLVSGYLGEKKIFFESHIEPLQAKMEQVHKDYVSGFQEARRILKDQTAPTETLLEFLRERRREYEYQRQLSRDLAAELENSKRVAIHGGLRESVEEYCQSVLDYFSASSGGVVTYSWYTYYLDSVELKARLIPESGDIWRAEGISGSPHRDLLQHIDRILDNGLPKAFGRVSAAYAVLRTNML